MDFLKLIKENNQDCNFTDSIIESKYVESISLNQSNSLTDSLTDSNSKEKHFLICILNRYNFLFSNIPDKDKKIEFNKYIMNICSNIDDNPSKYYLNFGYNQKIIKPQLIQQGFQSSYKNKMTFSTLIYLNDLYQTHFIIVDSKKKRFYKTCLKNYPINYLICNYNNYRLQDSIDSSYIEDNIENSIIIQDIKNIKNTNPYQLYLDPIGKYKLDDLKKIAKGFNISLEENNKTKLKKTIYDDINHYKLHN